MKYLIGVLIIIALLGWMGSQSRPSYCDGLLRYSKVCSPWLLSP